MATTGERIKALMQERQLSTRRLGAIVGASGVTVFQWCSDIAKPRGERLAKLAEFFGVTPGWILFGEEQQLSSSSVDGGDWVSIPVLAQEAGCGGGAPAEDIQLVRMLRVAKTWLRSKATPFSSFKNLHILTASGDSMSPGIEDGDFVIIDSSQTTFREDAVFALSYGCGIYLKRIQRHPGGSILLLSDNQKYPPISLVEQENITVVGKVILAFSARKV